MSKSYKVIIIGGGVIGSSIAYHLAAAGEASVLVVERDLTYKRASSALSASSIRQQFSTPLCIRMSQFGFEFLRNVTQHLSVDGEPVPLSLTERGYLYLANTPEQAHQLDTVIKIQREYDVPVSALDRGALAQQFPWLNSADLHRGALGTAGEGWFDGYSLLQAFRRKAKSLGVEYLGDEVVGLTGSDSRVSGVRLESGAIHGAQIVVNAAGPHSAQIAAWCGIDLPVQPQRRCIFAFTCPTDLSFIPLVIDPDGVFVRPEHNLFIAGGHATPVTGDDPLSLDVDYEQFNDVIWPELANRIPAFESIRLSSAWAGHYEMNTFDHNAIIGWAPATDNLLLATGFSGHGMQHSPAAGRAVAELIIQGRYTTLDLSQFALERVAANRPIVELNVI